MLGLKTIINIRTYKFLFGGSVDYKKPKGQY